MTPALRKKLLLYAGYGVFFVTCFLLFAYWTFPYDRLRDYIVQEVERPAGPDGQRRPSGVHLEIGSLSPSWLTGVEMEQVRFVKQPEDPEGSPIEITADEVEARVGLFALLGGATDVSFDVVVGGGEISGELQEDETSTHVEASIEDVELRQLGIMQSLIGLPVSGTANGAIALTVSDEASETSGDVSLVIDGLRIGGGQVPVPGMSSGLTVERIDAGKLELTMNVVDGVGRIEKLAADGQDLDVEGSGTIRLLRPLKMSRLDLMLRVAFSDAYRTRSDHTRRLFSAMDFVPDLRAAKTPDGALQWRVNGSFGSRIATTPAGRARPTP